MAIDTDAIFRYKTANRQKLIDFGFVETSDGLEKQTDIMKKQFTMNITVTPFGTVTFAVIDNATNEEYVLVHADNAQGKFIGEVRAACENVLENIAQKCFDNGILQAEQTKRIISAIETDYGVQPEFLWPRTPDCAAIRRKDNDKWFAVIMTIDKSKLGIDGHGNIEVIDLKANPDIVETLVKQNGYYKAYHMNKKHWFTVCLDDSIPDKVLHTLVVQSYKCAGKK